ncbi:nucleotidyltransferase family protein [Frankia sp. Cppng1_Ct_nod]|uniref:nucleotidyltransferase family protein n=1 Tax=Frankia sp. Cppng1_Ct_nod TaxID=2897162 RepID=UPI001040FA61|nr:nucleotidyltransferase family protein [Frankia sp. Cppng1_Ct_nod]
MATGGTRDVGGLLLAAGAGRRFGGPKALAMLDGEPLVERTVRLLVEGGCAPVFVVLGARAADVIRRADLSGARVVLAADWAEGMGASLRRGLAALAGTDLDAAVVGLADQPLIGAEAVRRLRTAHARGAVAAVAGYRGQPRNPVLLGRAIWAEVAAHAHGDVGARVWLRNNADRVVTVPCDGTGSPDDIDTPDDLARMSETTVCRTLPPSGIA